MKFCIKLDGNKEEVKRVLSILFNNGYVFCVDRLKNVNEIFRRYPKTENWQYAIVGHNRTCKAEIGILNSHESEMYNYQHVTVEKLLQLNDAVIG